MINYVNQKGNFFSPVSAKGIALMVAYNKIAAKSQGESFYNIVTKMGLSEKQIKALSMIMKSHAVCESNISGNDSSEESLDFTSLRADLEKDNESDLVIANLFVVEALNGSCLTKIERELMELAVTESKTGWQAVFAANHIKPNGKPISRQRIEQIYASAKAKVARYIELQNIREVA